MSPHDELLREIEDSEMRHEWAKAEIGRAGKSRDLPRYAAEALKELQSLSARKQVIKNRQNSNQRNSWDDSH
jgi:hypothetical protein